MCIRLPAVASLYVKVDYFLVFFFISLCKAFRISYDTYPGSWLPGWWWCVFNINVYVRQQWYSSNQFYLSAILHTTSQIFPIQRAISYIRTVIYSYGSKFCNKRDTINFLIPILSRYSTFIYIFGIYLPTDLKNNIIYGWVLIHCKSYRVNIILML